jgi:PAS domain S-box-containing protein
MQLTTGRLTVLLLDRTQAAVPRAAVQDLPVVDQLLVVQDLEEACTCLETIPVDVVMVGLARPDGPGLALLERIQACAPDVPLVVLTATHDDRAALEAIRRGAEDVLVWGDLPSRRTARVLRFTVERARNRRSTQGVIEALPTAVVVVDEDGTIRSVNGRAEAWFGYDRQELIGQPVETLVPVPARAGHAADRSQYVGAPEPRTMGQGRIFQARRKDGSTFPVEVGLTPIATPRGVQVLAVVVDATKRVKAQSQNQLLAASVAETNEAVVITDAHLDPPGPRIEFVNAAFTQMTGYAPDDVLGKTPRILQGPDTDRSVLSRLKATLQRGEPFQGETVNYRKSGEPYRVQWSITPVRDDDGRVTHFVSVQRDVTERRVAEQHQARLAAIVESTDDAIYGKTLDGVLTSWNAAAERLYGYTASEMIGTSVARLIPADHEEELDRIMATIRAGASARLPQTVRRRKDGSRVQVALTVSPVRNREGAVVGGSAIARDITAQKEMKEALQVSESRLQLALEAGEMLAWDWDIGSGTMHYFGNTFDLFGLTPEEIGNTLEYFLELIHPEDQEVVVERIWQTLADGQKEFEEEYRICVPSGSCHWVWTRGRVFYEDGRAVLATGMSLDVTARKQAQEALRDSEASYRNLFNSVTEAIFIHDQEGRFLDANQPALDMYGYEREELLGQTPALLAAPGRHQTPRVMAYIDDAFAGETRRLEWWGRRKNGDVFPHDVILSKGRYFGQEVVIATARDISAQKQYEQALIEAKERAEEMNRLKSTFLANMSHEIRTPLTSIIGFAELLSEEVEGAQNEFVELIARGGRRLLVTLNSVLDLSRLESGQMSIERRPLRLGPIIGQVADTFQKDAARKGLDLQVDLPEAPVYALVDEGAMVRVLTNLLANAIKFTPEGAVVVRLVPSAEGPVTVQVQDTGVGIGKEFLPNVFDEFKQESEGNSRAFEGTGLGLSITKRLVDLMEGTITVDSAKDEGSTFTVRLPRAPASGRS